MGFGTARVYDRRDGDGFRVLVDRLWPRGVAKGDGRVDEWLPEVAPSTELRRWFGHDPERFAGFAARYRAELEENEAVARLRDLGRREGVTLVYAARDTVHNHARVLADYLDAPTSTAGTSPVGDG
jgi:uncharacterized protein YeaO (DUF488 family)